MPDNPYQVVGSPNYAGPLVNWFGGQQNNQNKQPQQNQNQQQTPQQQQNMAAQLRALFGQQPQQPAAMDQQAYQQPGMPLNITPGSVAGANNLTSGIY